MSTALLIKTVHLAALISAEHSALLPRPCMCRTCLSALAAVRDALPEMVRRADIMHTALVAAESWIDTAIDEIPGSGARGGSAVLARVRGAL